MKSRRAELVLQPLQQLQDFLGHQRVERRGRLVADDQLGLGGQRAGDADALLLAAGELAGTAVGEVRRQADLRQQFGDPRLHLGLPSGRNRSCSGRPMISPSVWRGLSATSGIW